MSYEYARGTVPTVGYVETEGPNDFLTVSHCTGAGLRPGGLAALGTRGTHAVGGPGPPGRNPGASQIK